MLPTLRKPVPAVVLGKNSFVTRRFDVAMYCNIQLNDDVHEIS